MAARPLHFIWLADASGSMRVGGKIQALNTAIREAIPTMRTVAGENPHAAVLVRAMRFADHAQWLVEQPVPVGEFQWHDLEACGVTALGEALAKMGDALEPPFISERELPPIIALVTDGLPTDDFHTGLNHLLSKPWGRRALRIVVAIGEDAATAEAQENFRSFVANDALRPLQANNPEALAGHIHRVSTAVLKWVLAPPSQAGGSFFPEAVAAPAGVANVW
jgi:uncharacterized protein YegL